MKHIRLANTDGRLWRGRSAINGTVEYERDKLKRLLDLKGMDTLQCSQVAQMISYRPWQSKGMIGGQRRGAVADVTGQAMHVLYVTQTRNLPGKTTMKKIVFIAAMALTASQVQAGWFDSLSGNDKETVEAPAQKSSTSAAATSAAMGLLPSLTGSLGVTESQASGGVGALLQAAQGTLNANEFASLSQSIPGADALLKAAPAVTGNSEMLGGILNAAGQYSNTAKMIGQVTTQFEALGLDPAMIGKYVSHIQGFLQTSGGKTAVDLFTKSMAGLI